MPAIIYGVKADDRAVIHLVVFLTSRLRLSAKRPVRLWRTSAGRDYESQYHASVIHYIVLCIPQEIGASIKIIRAVDSERERGVLRLLREEDTVFNLGM